jgi:cell division septation protein DedD
MPDLNLKDEDEFAEQGDEEQRTLRPSRYQRGRGDGLIKLLPIAIILLIILGIVMLNQFGVIHLWGSKGTPVVVDLPPLEDEAVQTIPEVREPVLAPIDSPAVEEVVPTQPAPAQRPVTEQAFNTSLPAGTGQYTVQVSAWRTRERAEAQVARIRAAGKPAFMDETLIGGTTWYRVRIGRYATREEAVRDAESFQLLLETGWWVDTIDG